MDGTGVDEAIGQLRVPARKWLILLDRLDGALPAGCEPEETKR
jgi:hypothetical protein